MCMKALFYFSGFLSVMLLSGCNDVFLSPDEKLEGTWHFDKVTYTRSGFSFGSHNVTSDFRDIDIEFERNGDVTWYDMAYNDEYNGEWDLRYYYDYDYNDDRDERINVLNLILVDFDNEDIMHYEWELQSFTRRKIIAEEYVGNRRYRYKLKKY